MTASVALSDADHKGGLRAAGRLSCIIGTLLVALMLHGAWRALGRRSPWPPRFLRRVAIILGADIRVTGTPLRRDAMIAANHLSWMDILLLAGTSGTRFVAKAEVAALPLIGWLAGLNRTVFVARGDRLGVGDQVATIRAALTERQTLAIFPEGTTGDDLHLLPFKPALFAALVPPIPGIRVQPVRIDYGAAAADLAWLGDDAGDAHARRVLRRPGRFVVTLHYLEPFDPADCPDRKAIAAEARARIAAS
ncbi:1-acyl-sn-glycerol-3-phosphate acyltransferase [Sphingomonas sp. SORGH_AS870]|uniref:lysophospholipid acyltransferase family protein n=1 Tax=Sphingomonas sp. SORGH_AS_0870 TaxID=3041801 RepID=UPI00285A8507|nr:lysophospholipid acyltransferase family protein [Sphingomonas sp. SORGH_AS_0870]MDR6145222.1 1-acyl-sn-glycerol-3-phosphate acyltransferase [Sphingomonas sp. SORGH_AS_0870]